MGQPRWDIRTEDLWDANSCLVRGKGEKSPEQQER